MAKRREIDVDEELIKSMMAGDIPRLKKEPEKERPVHEKEVEGEIPEDKTIDDEKEKGVAQLSKQKRRREPKDYASLFLQKTASTKRQTYVNADLYDKVAKIIGIIAKDISVPNFIDNVLENHLKEYKDEINEMYRNKSDLIL